MPAFVKTAADEERWEKAKRIVEEEYGRTESSGDKYWRLVTAIFEQMKKSLPPGTVLLLKHPNMGKSEKPPVVIKSSSRGIPVRVKQRLQEGGGVFVKGPATRSSRTAGIKVPDGPEIAGDGKCYIVKFAEGMAVQCFRSRKKAARFALTLARKDDLAAFTYGDVPRRKNGRPIPVTKGLSRNAKITLALASRILPKLHLPAKDVDAETLRRGMEVELEHVGGDTAVATSLLQVAKIAAAHLKESPDYYTELAKMEEKLAKSARKLQGRLEFQGLKISIENRKGTYRRGVNKKTGEKWETKTFWPYGYILGSVGKDGEHVDCFVGPNPDAAMAYIIHQNTPDGKRYDEDKVLLGFDSEEHARDAFLAHYDTHKFLGEITAMPMTEFIEKVSRKKQRGKMIKSHVRGHYRTVNGRKVWVEEHEDSRTKQAHYTGKVHVGEGVQYRYAREWQDARASEKFNRAAHLATVIRPLTQDVKDMLYQPIGSKERAVGAIIALIDQFYMRMGSLESREAHDHYGATTLERRHVHPKPNGSVELDFTGKAGVGWSCEIPAGRLAQTVTRLASHCKDDRDLVFRYRKAGKWKRVPGSAVNSELAKWGLTTKDFRTYHASRLAFELLKGAVPAGSEAVAKKSGRNLIVRHVIEEVAQVLNHEPSVCRAKYVAPEVYERFLKTGKPARSSRFRKSLADRRFEDEEEFIEWLVEEGARRGGGLIRKGHVARYYRRGTKGQRVFVGGYERRGGTHKPKAGDIVQVYIRNTYRGPVFMRVSSAKQNPSGVSWYTGTTYKTLADLVADREGKREDISDMGSTFRLIRNPEAEAKVEMPAGLWARGRKKKEQGIFSAVETKTPAVPIQIAPRSTKLVEPVILETADEEQEPERTWADNRALLRDTLHVANELRTLFAKEYPGGVPGKKPMGWSVSECTDIYGGLLAVASGMAADPGRPHVGAPMYKEPTGKAQVTRWVNAKGEKAKELIIRGRKLARKYGKQIGEPTEPAEKSLKLLTNGEDLIFKSAEDSKKPKQWWEDAKAGDERWITIHPSESPEDYRHVKVKLRPSGKWRIVAGGTYLEHQEIVPKHELSEGEKAHYEERRKTREAARKEREKELEQVRGVKEQHTAEIARAAGIAPELGKEQKEAIERKAESLHLEAKERARFVEKETGRAEETHKKWVAQAVSQIVSQSRAVTFAVEPEKELAAIKQAREEEEAQKKRAGERLMEARLAAASREAEATPGELKVEAEPEPMKPKDEPIYTANAVPVIASVEAAQKLAILARESEKKLREARKVVPKAEEDRVSGTEALEEFTLSAEIADSKQAERELLQEREDRLREQLNCSMIDIADATWQEDAETDSGAYQRFGKAKYDVARAQSTGALDAISGISKHFLGSSFMDRPIVDALGIDGAAALMAGEIVRRRGKEDAARILTEIEDYQHEVSRAVAETALSRHKELIDAKKTLEQAANEPLVDDKGNLLADKLIQGADATALYGELSTDALRHVGTALGSLQASSSLMRLLKSGIQGGKRLEVLRVALRDPEDAKRIDRALHLKGRYKMEEIEGGGYAMVVSPKSLARYLKEAKHDGETEAQVQAIQDGTVKVDVNAVPEGWKRTFVDEEGKSQRFGWKEGQKRALDFALARSNEKGGGAVIDLEVGGGKTAFAVGYLGSLKEKGWIGEGRRGLYVAPKDSLASQVMGDIGKFTEYTTDRIGGGGRSHEEEIAARYRAEGFISVVTAPTLAADVKALENMGVDPSEFFRDLGYDGIVLDEAHQLVAGASGGGKTGAKIRKLHLKYGAAMTGTLATNAISQPFDMVRWAVGNKVDSRAKVLRKYGEVGLGTEAWQEAVNEDVRAQIDRYTFHGTGQIDAKLISREQKVNLSHQQRATLREAVVADKARTKAALAGARRQGRSILDQAAKMKLKGEYDRDVYEILHDRDWHTNPRLQEIGKLMESELAKDPSHKFIIIGDTSNSIAGVHAVAQMLTDEGHGGEMVMMASRSLEDKAISQQQMTRSQAKFAVDPNCRFAVLAEPQAIGRNLTAGDSVIHLDVPPNAASRKQRRGRAYRTGRTRDVEEVMFWTDQHAFDVGRKLTMQRTAGMLEAASGR